MEEIEEGDRGWSLWGGGLGAERLPHAGAVHFIMGEKHLTHL